MKKLNNKGFTLMEMLIVIVILVILLAIIMLFVKKPADTAAAASNSANLRAVRAELNAHLIADPEHYEENKDKVLSTAPGAAGVEVPGMSVPEGTPMDAIITEDGTVDTFYGDYNEEDFEDVVQDGSYDVTEGTNGSDDDDTSYNCGVLSCFSIDLLEDGYCADHQMKICQKKVLANEKLVDCATGYRVSCENPHYKTEVCGCKRGSDPVKETYCNLCKHWHNRSGCNAEKIVEDNSLN